MKDWVQLRLSIDFPEELILGEVQPTSTHNINIQCSKFQLAALPILHGLTVFFWFPSIFPL